MNTEDLHVALKQSFSPDASLRIPAETLIKSLKHVGGASIMLLQIAAEKQVSEKEKRNRNMTLYIYSLNHLFVYGNQYTILVFINKSLDLV